MKVIIRKTAALILALAMIVTFMPIYGMGAIAYAEDEEVAAEQNTAGGEDLAAGEEISGNEAGEGDQISPDEEDPVGEDPIVEEPVAGDEAAPEEVVVEEAAGEEEEPFIAKGIKKAPISIDKGDDDGDDDGDDNPFPFPNFELEQTDGVQGRLYDTGNATFKIPDEAFAIDGTQIDEIEPFVGIPQDGPWESLGTDCFYYDKNAHTITVFGSKIAEIYPPVAWVPDDIGISFEAFDGTDHSDGHTLWIAGTRVQMHYSYVSNYLPEDRSVLPHWDGSINGTMWAYVDTEEYPNSDDEDIPLQITDVEVSDEDRDLLEDFHPDSDDDNHWWYYRAGSEMGTVTFHITYTDYDGVEKTHDMHLHIGGDIYEANLYSEGDIDMGLPGSEIIFHAWGNHKYMTEGEDSHEDQTDKGLEFEWTLERGSDLATITPVPGDPTTAVLKFNEPEEGQDPKNGGARVKVIIKDTRDPNNPDQEKASAQRWIELRDDYYYIMPAGLNVYQQIGQTETATFELRHYKYGGGEGYNDEGFKPVDIEAFRWNFDENAFVITQDGGEAVSEGDWVSGSSKFSLTRKGDWRNDIHLQVKYSDEEGNPREYGRNYWFFDMNYDLWFDRGDIDVFSDIPDEDFQEATTFRLDTGNFGSGDEAEENFDFTITAGNLREGTDYFVNRDGNELVVTFNRESLKSWWGRDIRIEAKVESKTLDWSRENDVWLHLREARYDFDPESPREMLPGWDYGTDKLHVYIENTEYPWGQDFDFPITGVYVDPDEAQAHLEDLDISEDGFWFRAGSNGQVDFLISYIDEKDVEHTGDDAYRFTVNIVGDIYEVWQHRDGPSDNGLPGTSIELWADGVHRYITKNGEQRETWEGLDYGWRFAYGEEFATLTVDENDHSHATLTFKELPDGEDWIDEEVRVEVGLMDPESDDPQDWRAMEDRNYWVRSEYDELWPTELGLLNLGQSTDDITFTVRHYSLSENGEAGYREYPVDKMEWRFNQDDISISFEEDELSDGEQKEGDTFSFFRKKSWDTNADYTVWFRDEYGGECEMGGGFHFDTLNYDQWFDSHDVNVYDDWPWTINLQRNEDLDYSGLETRIRVGHYEDEDVFVPAPDNCWSLSDDGMSVTVYGDKMAENDIREMWVYAEAFYDGEDVGESGECNVRLEESCTSRGEEHLWLEAPPEYADCYSPGWQKMMCWNCHEKRIVEVPARGHIATEVKAKAATASKEGNVQYWTCSFCGKVFSDKDCTNEVDEDSRIIPKGITLSKLTAQSKGFTATWKKPAGDYLTHTTGYEIQYALDSKFKKSPKTVSVTKNTTVTKKVTKLKAKTKYYVRIRTYRTIDGKKAYSPWSKAKTITTK